MRHFVICKHCNSRLYINTKARIRAELPFSFTIVCSICNKVSFYYPYEVTAETSVIGSSGGALLGGLLGLASGGAGAIIGALLGAALGGSGEKVDNDAVQRFNTS